jgi:hypothetical protein
MLFSEIIGVYCENHAKYTNKLRAQHAEILISKQVSRVPNGQIEYVLEFEGIGFDICCMHEFHYLQVCNMRVLRGTKPVICLNS